jgi:hypothetical protein
MHERQLVTRKMLRRELALNAATRPLTVTATAAVAVAAFTIGAAWLLAVATLLYIGLAVATFLDHDEAERVGRAVYEAARGAPAAERVLPVGLAAEIASLLERTHAEERRIRRAIAESELPLESVSIDFESLTAEIERNARRAQVIRDYLGEQEPGELRRRISALRDDRGGTAETGRAREHAIAALEEQLRTCDTLRGQLERFTAEMEHLIASLGAVHGQLVRASVANDEHLQALLADDVRNLRNRVAMIADGIGEAVTELDAT